MYSIHLKSGRTTEIKKTRFEEAMVLRADGDALGADAHIIYGGDFNWTSASERGLGLDSAWDVFTSEGHGQGFDTFDVDNVLGVGDWDENSRFITLHSHDAGRSMNDRFDMQLVTDDFLDGTGLELIEGSYRVFANDGSHSLNEPITTGSGATEDVLIALANFGGHLPVISDFTIVEVLIGDIDGDGCVAFSDFLILSANFGMPGTKDTGDIDGDDLVEFSDFLLLSGNFGKKLNGSASVPESVPTPIAALVLLGMLRRRKLAEAKSSESF